MFILADLLSTLKRSELQKIVKMYTQEANVKLANIREAGADKLSKAFMSKWNPYLEQHGTKKGNFRTGVSRATKAELIERLQNLQQFRKNIKQANEILREAEETAEQFGLDNVGDLQTLFDLVNYGYDSLAYKIGSDDMFKIVSERLNAGQTAEEIKQAIDTAASLAESGDEFIQDFSEGGNWL